MTIADLTYILITLKPNYISREEATSAAEVIQQHDLTTKQRTQAMRLINDRGRVAPFNRSIAYMVSHHICSAVKASREPETRTL